MKVDTNDKKRISFWISITMNNRLEADSKIYGTTKSDIIRVALLDYYRKADEFARR